MALLKDVLAVFEQFAPSGLAESWDNSGLQFGDINQNIDTVLVSLNPSLEVIKEACDLNCQLLFSHHPLFFPSVNNIVKSSYHYRILKIAFENNINIYSAHTNLDKAKVSLNTVLADFFGYIEKQPLIPDTSFLKLVFFAEASYSKKIINELCRVGAGIIGKYTNTSFKTNGIGTFMPQTGARPKIGKIGIVNEVNEDRVEIIVHKSVLNKVIAKLIEVHPYEEVAYDVYNLSEVKKSQYGMGSIGFLKENKLAKDIVKDFTKKTKSSVKFIGNPGKNVKKAAIVAGSGASFIEQAYQLGADLLITADVKYHDCLIAEQLGLSLIVASHFALEKLAMDLLTPKITDSLNKAGYTIEVLNSKKESDVYFED